MLYFFDHHNANLASLTEIEETNSQEVCVRFRLIAGPFDECLYFSLER